MNIEGKIRGILLGEDELTDILTRKYRKKVLRIETYHDEFKACFDPSEDINAVLLDTQDLGKVLKEYYGVDVMDIVPLSHEEYLIKFTR